MSKKICSYMLCLIMLFTIVSLPGINAIAETKFQVGDKITDLDIEKLKTAGYQFIDDRDENISYTWPYTIDAAFVEKENAYMNTYRWTLGQTGCTITYSFEGTFIAAVFAELYDAANIQMAVDGQKLGTYRPKGNEEVSRIAFIKDDLANSLHTVVILLEAVPEEDNLGNNTMFDCFITKKAVDTGENEKPKAVTAGTLTKQYDDSILDGLKLKAIDNTDENIFYTWPMDIDGSVFSNSSTYGGTFQYNQGQVSTYFACDFEGTYLAVAFAECFFAATIIIDVDGDILDEITPFSDLIKYANAPSLSKVVFVADDLLPGEHTLTVFFKTAFTSGELNPKGEDEVPYYDNESYFDCIFVQKEPTQPSPKPSNAPNQTEQPTAIITSQPTESPAPTVSPDPTAGKTKDGDHTSSKSMLYITGGIVAVLIIVAAVLLIVRKRRKSK